MSDLVGNQNVGFPTTRLNLYSHQLKACDLLVYQCLCHDEIVHQSLYPRHLCRRVYSFYAPNFEKVGTYWFRLVRMYVCMCVCIHVRDIVLKLHVWIPHGKIADAFFWFSLNYLPLLNYGPLTNKGMKCCKCRISKSIIARNL